MKKTMIIGAVVAMSSVCAVAGQMPIPPYMSYKVASASNTCTASPAGTGYCNQAGPVPGPVPVGIYDGASHINSPTANQLEYIGSLQGINLVLVFANNSASAKAGPYCYQIYNNGSSSQVSMSYCEAKNTNPAFMYESIRQSATASPWSSSAYPSSISTTTHTTFQVVYHGIPLTVKGRNELGLVSDSTPPETK